MTKTALHSQCLCVRKGNRWKGAKEEESERAAHWPWCGKARYDYKVLACSGNKEKQDLQQIKGGKKESTFVLGARFLLHCRNCTVSLGTVAAVWLFPCFGCCVPAMGLLCACLCVMRASA